MNLSPELIAVKNTIRECASNYGLDFFETFFELLDVGEVNEIAAFSGFPKRYPHWRFGMTYDKLSKGHTYGLQKIYELVINNDPCYAYLISANSLVDQKLIIAHVLAHSDFFKNNMWFANTNRKMIDQMANHTVRIHRHIDRIGYGRVEEFLDACLALENTIDLFASYTDDIPSNKIDVEKDIWELGRTEDWVVKIPSKDYMDPFINPPEFIEEQQIRLEHEASKPPKFPREPERDLMRFLLYHAPLRQWERDILSIVRNEAYYFAPQGMTKIMNEGWATYWHSKIMTQDILDASEIVDFADVNSRVLCCSPTSLNPYKLGLELFKDIEDRWNKGKFGKEWDECKNLDAIANWDLKLDLGRKKIFEVRKVMNDVSFIDTFLTEKFCHEQKLFMYSYNEETERTELVHRDFKLIKQKLLTELTNAGQPRIDVIDGNYKNKGELFLCHRWDGSDLKQSFTEDTLKSIFKLWTRPVHIKTVLDDDPIIVSFDGNQIEVASDGN